MVMEVSIACCLGLNFLKLKERQMCGRTNILLDIIK